MASFLSTLFGGGAETDAANANKALYQQYLDQGNKDLATGYQTSQGALNNALGAYQPLSDLAGKYTQGTDLYLNSLGVNGAAGNAAATQAYQQSPGYQNTLNQGLDAITRQRAASGMLNSGNTSIDTMNYATGLANNDYTNWQNQLAGVNNNALSATSGAASGQAGVYGAQSDLSQQNAQNQVGLLGNYTSGNAAANNSQAAGEAAGAKNLLGGALSLASLGLTAGGVGGFGSGLKTGSSFGASSPSLGYSLFGR